MATDETYMSQALELAKRGRGYVNPNPAVGCVLVRDGRVIGEGWHTQFGRLHAEREALADCARRGEDARGATAYVTLEPCCHFGKTPPCADGLIEAGVARVVVGAADANPQVAGKGCAKLRAAGVSVTEGVLRQACEQENRAFFHYIQTGLPYVIAKFAMTLDGKIATRTGSSRWVTGEAARERVHADRHRFMAVMVGVNTVLADDPALTCRLPQEAGARPWRQPLRVVCDTNLRTPLSSRLVRTAHEAGVLIVTCENDEAAHAPYVQAGCEVAVVSPDENGHADVREAVRVLGQRNVDSVIAEGGSALLGSLFDVGAVDAVQAYIAPKVFGGLGKSPVGGLGIELASDAVRFGAPQITRLGDDVLLECELMRAR